MKIWTGYLDKFGKKIYNGDKITIEHLIYDIGRWRKFKRNRQIGIVVENSFKCTNEKRYRAKEHIRLCNYFVEDQNLLVKL